MSNFVISPRRIKIENTKALRKAGIEVIDHLPAIDECQTRSPTAVASRWLAMAALLQLHFEAPEEFVEKYLLDNGLSEAWSSEERQLLDKGYHNLERQQRTDLYWTIEAIWALAWAGKKHDALSLNTAVEDGLASMLPDFQEEEPAQPYIVGYHLRSKKELFTKLDMLYRAHWFARNKDLSGGSSPLVDLDIIVERRKALEWVCDNQQEWDEISLDT